MQTVSDSSDQQHGKVKAAVVRLSQNPKQGIHIIYIYMERYADEIGVGPELVIYIFEVASAHPCFFWQG